MPRVFMKHIRIFDYSTNPSGYPLTSDLSATTPTTRDAKIGCGACGGRTTRMDDAIARHGEELKRCNSAAAGC